MNLVQGAAEIAAIVERFSRDQDFSGVCLVAHDDNVLLHKAVGLAHRGFAIPNTLETRFDIASVTKLFTAAAVLQLVEQGRLRLEEPLMPLLGLGETSIRDEVTIYQCLTHTSGIGDDADEEAGENYEDLFRESPNYSIRNTADFVPQCTTRAANFPPGAEVRYNNCAYVLLGMAVEKITGKTYRQYVQEQVFERAGMKHADFCAMDGDCVNLAEHYERIEQADGGIAWRKNIYSYPPIGSPEGGATVTAMDLHRFMQAVLNNELMEPVSSKQFVTPQFKSDDLDTGSEWVGFGFQFRKDASGEIVEIGKDGINAGVASYLAYYPVSGVACVVLSNQDFNVWTMMGEVRQVILDV